MLKFLFRRAKVFFSRELNFFFFIYYWRCPLHYYYHLDFFFLFCTFTAHTTCLRIDHSISTICFFGTKRTQDGVLIVKSIQACHFGANFWTGDFYAQFFFRKFRDYSNLFVNFFKYFVIIKCESKYYVWESRVLLLKMTEKYFESTIDIWFVWRMTSFWYTYWFF